MTAQRLQFLIKTHQAQVYRYLRYLGAQDATLAEDLTQETFLAVYQSQNVPPDDQIRRQGAWIRGVARNIFLMYCRKAKADPLQFNARSLEQAENVWSQKFLRQEDGFDFAEALRSCLGRIPTRSLQALKLRYWKKQSRTQMAGELGLSEDGVKSMLRRIRSALKKCIENRFEEPIGIVDATERI